jgi:hypothetical protein
MAYEPFDWRLPVFSGRLSSRQETVALTLVLLGGLLVFAPLFAVTVDAIGLPLPRPILFGVALAWVGYGVTIFLFRRIADGLFVGLIVASTFSADIPLTASANTFPGDTVGTLMMYHGPLLGLLVTALLFGWHRDDLPRSVYAFAAFVGATVLSALFGGGPDALVALWFSAYVLAGFLVYVLTILAVRHGGLSLHESIGVFFVVVCAQAIVGTVQLVREAPFGFSELGEAGRLIVAKLSLPFLPPISLGTHVGGFTGMAFQLSNLLIVTFPLLVVAYVRTRGWRRYLPLGAGLLFVLLVRGSSSDAARGAFIASILAFAVLGLAVYRPHVSVVPEYLLDARDSLVRVAVWAVSVGVLLLYPSSGAGRASSQSVAQPDGGSSAGTATDGTGSTGTSGSSGGGSWMRERIQSVESLSVPFFDLSNLGTRINQYLAGLDLFLQYPLFGIGGMNFVLVGHEYGIRSPVYTDLTYPIHSLYITLLVETGIIGFLTFMITVGFIYLYGYRAARARSDALVPIALLAGLSGTLAFMLLDHFLLTNAATWAQFWIVAGFVTVAYLETVE